MREREREREEKSGKGGDQNVHRQIESKKWVGTETKTRRRDRGIFFYLVKFYFVTFLFYYQNMIF